MEQVFLVIEPDGEIPTIFAEPDTGSGMVVELVRDNKLYLKADSAENAAAPDGWKHLEFRPTPTAAGDAGWLQVKFIGPAHNFEVSPVDEVEFVQACARAEIKASAGGEDGAPAILADYLIALALIESELTKFGNRLPGTSALGPFQITLEEWQEFLAANPSSTYAPFQFYQPLAQIAAAQYLTQRDWDALEAEAAGDEKTVEPEQVYIPSFLLLFQARLIGAKAAFAINRIHATGEAQTLVSDALKEFYPDQTEREALIKRRQRFLRLRLNLDDTTVDNFVEITSSVLADAFKTAFTKLKQHFPEFAIPPAVAGTPWLGIAQQEQAIWSQADVSEATPKGKAKVKDYFGATEYHPDTVEPWCGAFVAWCLKQADAPVVKAAATAKSWKTWGSMELRKGGLTDPKISKLVPGAVVVLHPAGDTGTTGHACFAISYMEGSGGANGKLTCIGGNQSDTVRTDPFKISRIASIRVMTPVEMPGGDDQLILARTIYGEARGEKEEGQQAVAEVVRNRARSGRYPASITAVCLQPWQFSCWNTNDPNRSKILSLTPNGNNATFNACFAVAGAVLAAENRHLTTQVLHYYADYISAPSWVRKSRNPVMEKKIGRHLFYRGID